MKSHRNALLKRSRREWAREDLTLLLRLMILGLLVLAGAMACGGCSQPVPQKKKFTMTNPFYRDRPQRAARMTCIWEPKMLAEKQSVVRGFQGEIIFFRDDKMEQSTLVDGELTVYVYDADDHNIVDLGGVEGIRPLCEYRFNSEALAQGMAKNKKSKMISYGVWLPLDTMPGDEKHLVLWSKFEGSGDRGELLGTDPHDQITVYLPGNPVERKKRETQLASESYGGIRQASYNEISDFGTAQQSSYAEAVHALQYGNQPNDVRRNSDAIPLSPGLARQLFNARQQEREEASTAGTLAATYPSTATGTSTGPTRDTRTNRSTGISFGTGNAPEPYANAQPNPAMSNGMSPLYVARNRQNITSIGAQIDQRMQNGLSFAVQDQNDGGIRQVSYDQPNSQPNTAEPGRRAEIRQEMTRIMAEQEQRRRLQNQAVNAQGFTEYNASTFATDQNRITVPESSWGVHPLRGQSQGDSQPNRYPAQNPGTSLSAYEPSDWGPGLESVLSDRETQVTYSQSAAGRIYR